MIIVDRDTFLAMPSGTVYAKVTSPPSPDFEPMEIKGDTSAIGDFHSRALIGYFEYDDENDERIDPVDALLAGQSRRPAFDCDELDGLFDDDQLFAIFEREDVERLIDQLQQTLLPRR